MNKDLAKELYFWELKDKHQQDSRTTLQVGVLSILGGVLFFCLRNFHRQDSWFNWLFACLVGAGLIFYILALIQVVRANIGHEYERLPSADRLHQYFKELQTYYSKVPSASGSPEERFDDFLKRHMVSAASRNARANLSRSARHYSAVRYMACAVAFSLLAAVLVALTLRNVPPSASAAADRVCQRGHCLSVGGESP